MADIVIIELGFGQQVAAEAIKTFRNSHFAVEIATVALVPDSLTVREIKF
jgi:hypothetical protein